MSVSRVACVSLCAPAPGLVLSVAVVGLMLSILNTAQMARAADHISEEGKMVYDSRWPLLLVDKYLVDKSKDVSLTVCEAVRHSRLDSLDKLSVSCGAVYYIDGKFRMWSGGGKRYAESQDGIQWTNGADTVGLGNRAHNCCVFYDPDDPDPSRRYKISIGKATSRGRTGLWTIAFSADGLRWKIQERDTPMCGSDEDAEGQTMFRVGKTCFISGQQLSPAFVETRPGYRGRASVVFHSRDPDLNIWTKAPKAVWAIPEGNGPYQAHHGIGAWSRPNLIIGLYGIFQSKIEVGDRATDLGLILSHDGFQWWEPWQLATILRRGVAGAWDSKYLVQGTQNFVNVGDKTYLYYYAADSDKGCEGLGHGTGLATLRRDGFGYQGLRVGWNFKPATREGEFVTAPIQLHDANTEQVLLNLDNVSEEKDRWVKVEVLDEKYQPVAGYGLADSDKLTTEGIAVPATWKGNASLGQVGAKVIRLRFLLHGGKFHCESPRMYAIYFKQPKEIE